MALIDNIKAQFKNGSHLTRFIYINVALFALIQIVYILTGGKTEDNYWGNAFVRNLAFHSDPIGFLTHPWGIITYMFTHEGLRHVFFNLLVLYFTGKIFQEYLGEKRLTTVYIGGGIAGALLFFLVSNLTSYFGVHNTLIGASAGVMAILIALTVYVPNLPVRLFFLIEVKLWHVATLFILFDLSGIAGFDNSGGRISHIGGALFGYLFIYYLRRGNDLSDWAFNLFGRLKKMFESKPKLKTVHKSATQQQKSKPHASDQKRLDDILDKIKTSGYDNLSKEEKEFLFKFGNK